MIRGNDKILCEKLGLWSGQMRVPNVYRNLWWSLDVGHTAFGYGDLDGEDIKRILEWLKSQDAQAQVTNSFTGWNEHHDTVWQQTRHPMIMITRESGVTYPHKVNRTAGHR